MITSIFPVWSELNLMSQVYWIITAPASLIFIVLIILTIFGSDVDSDIPSDFDHPMIDGDGIPFQFLSLKNIIGFFTMFGWSGLALINAGSPNWVTIIISIICGLLMMVTMATLFYYMSKLSESGNLNLKNAIGRVGEVYLSIPSKGEGMGKVQITIQSTLQTLDAISNEPNPINSGSLIEVIEVIDQQILLVKRVSN